MFRHVVLYAYQPQYSDTEINKVYDELDQISARLSGRISYTWGKYSSHEGRNKGYTHCLVTDFSDLEARNAFIDDEVRIEFSKREVLPKMVNGVDSIISFDFEWQDF
jgi:hypothetical protein